MDKKIMLSRMRKNVFMVVGLSLALTICLLCFLSPLFVKFDPELNSLSEKLLPPQGFGGGLSGHILGTDQMGRDVLTRLLVGGRYSLVIAFIVVIVQAVIGTILGIISGYMGKWADVFIMRLCDIFLAIPNLILAIAVMAVLGTNPVNLVSVLIFSGWVNYCKVTRNSVRVIKNQEFVHASQVLGAGSIHIMFRQIFPNVTTNLIIIGSQKVGQTILVEAALSFLSLGIQPPTPSWGNMISTGRTFLMVCPWLVLAPGIALMLTVLAFNFLGDGLRDVLDPRRIT